MKIAFIRGAYINNFELQSYYPIADYPDVTLHGFSSRQPKHTVQIPTTKLYSPTDLPDIPYKLPLLNRLIGGDAMYLWQLEPKLKGYDIAHVRETYFHFSSQAIAAKKSGYVKKVLVTCSETIPFNHESIWGRKRLKKNVLTYADHFHCLTQKAKLALKTEGVPVHKITVIPYGLDLDTFTSKVHDNQDVIKAVFIGRLEAQKGVEELIQAYQQLTRTLPTLELTCYGRGPLAQAIMAAGLECKWVPYSKIPDILAESDILILPSKPDRYWEEYFGMVLLEAMASQTAIVSTKCGAIPDVVGDAAVLVAPNSANALAAGIKQLVVDVKLRKQLAKKGRSRAYSLYNAHNQAKKLYKLYSQILTQ